MSHLVYAEPIREMAARLELGQPVVPATITQEAGTNHGRRTVCAYRMTFAGMAREHA